MATPIPFPAQGATSLLASPDDRICFTVTLSCRELRALALTVDEANSRLGESFETYQRSLATNPGLVAASAVVKLLAAAGLR